MIKQAVFAALAVVSLAGPAAAVTVNYTNTGAGSFTLFPGLVQQTIITMKGCPGGTFQCQNGPDLTIGTPVNVITHFLELTSIGQNDGGFNGPSGSFSAPLQFTFGAQTITLTQQVGLRQISNGQFQFNVDDSSVQSIVLAGIGTLELKLLGAAGQYVGGSPGGGGQGLRTRFTLLDAAVPEPASWALMITGFGMAGGALRARRGRIAAIA